MFRIIDITKKKIIQAVVLIWKISHSDCMHQVLNSAKTHCASLKQDFYSACQTNKLTETSFSISCTVGDIYAINIVAVKTVEKNDDEEEEEFVKYGAVDEFYDLKKEIGK